MAELQIKKLFEYRNVVPSGLQKGNLIYFRYQSPNGVHDKSPLVYVLDKSFDRFFGINVHYVGKELQQIVDNIEGKTNSFFENKWYSKHPEKRQELREKRETFSPSMIDQKEFNDLSKGFNKRDLEVFTLQHIDQSAFRCYLYKRMNNVSKLVWKLQQL